MTPLLCPTDEVVVGFEGRSGSWLDAFSLRCAPLDDTGALGTVSSTVSLGGLGGGAFGATDCAAGEVVTGAELYAYIQYVSTVTFHCGAPNVE